ncbi:hypothetical protein [Streptomyces sp. MB09-02B]|uniref:hypothetical protein n=1 Tax=Streptomyces sp. MB09-02B TaxID=3028667 RepID=UPI0039AFECB1
MTSVRRSTAATATAVVLAAVGGLLAVTATSANAAATCASPVFKRQLFANTAFSGATVSWGRTHFLGGIDQAVEERGVAGADLGLAVVPGGDDHCEAPAGREDGFRAQGVGALGEAGDADESAADGVPPEQVVQGGAFRAHLRTARQTGGSRLSPCPTEFPRHKATSAQKPTM